MYKWIISRTEHSIELQFINGQTNELFCCGKTSADLRDADILEWIFKDGGICNGDLIQMSNGTVTTWSKQSN